jgi:hypothetical protein
MSAFDPLRTFERLGILHRAMADPFRSLALQGWIKAGGALVLLAALMFAISYLKFVTFGTAMTAAQVVEAEVLRLGARPVARVRGGDLPILTVRLPDGSVRNVQATWGDVNRCKPGRSISLLQQGSALRVGRPGCFGVNLANDRLPPIADIP